MSDSTTPPPPPPPPSAPQAATRPWEGSNRAVIALVLGILSLICCNPLGPVAWYLGNEELKAIQAGTVPDTNRVMAQIAVILGIIGTILLAFLFLWIIFLGGMATLGSFAGSLH